jgi:hypothetical protein
MKHTLKNQAKQAGIALAAVAALAALGTGTAQAQSTATFASTNIALDRFGNLECNFRETGLTPASFVRYDCTSQFVGVLQQCILKNRPVGNSQLLIFQNIHPEEVENVLVKNNGTVFTTILTPIPEAPNNSIICTAPSELTTTAIRWCNNSVVDLTNSVPGGTVAELFANLVTNGTGSVPSCAVLANGPFTPPGE